ncbi:MAG: (d)CMP kinase [Deltaproteobacteria bacterium]|nr:(d)CMP kinase [Deltaproteobacteria bacterium]
MPLRRIITVDGLAGSGKSTLARLLAEKLDFVHLNSGLLYRAIGYLALQEHLNLQNEEQLKSILPLHRVALDLDLEGKGVVTLDGRNISDLIQSPEVSEATSMASQYPCVRKKLLELQREAFPTRSMVVEGRDMGTVVFPKAPLKFFVTADESVRVARRLAQLMEASSDKSDARREELAKKIRIEIAERDKRDMERAVAPTYAAKDAVHIDNSSEPLEKVVEHMVSFAKARSV